MNYQKVGEITSNQILKQIDAVIHHFDTPVELAHFLAQCHHESGGFKKVVENMNYSSAKLLQVFPKYFNEENVQLFASNPQRIANKVYGGRMGNVNPNDGWDFRGRGYIQLTGRSNYELFEKDTGLKVVENPGLVATLYPMESAVWFWERNKIGDLCVDSTDKTIRMVTRRINGGTNGLSHRKELTNKYLRIIEK